MFKVLLGAGLVVVLVGYGVLTPQTLEDAGARAIKEYGDYEGFGFLKQRDTEQELVVVIDEKSDNEFVCAYADIWDVDEVELIEG